LFGVVGTSGIISNVHLEDVDIDVVTGNGNFEFFIGGLAGKSLGTISGCSVTGTLNATVYEIAAGGLVGSVGASGAGSVTDCTSACILNIACTYQTAHAGGLVGEVFTAGSSVSNCTSTGTVTCRGGSDTAQTGPTAGGLIGYAGGGTGSGIEIKNCRSDCAVHATGARSQANAGGLIGCVSGKCIISDCTGAGDVEASGSTGSAGVQVDAGGLIGWSSSSSVITNCYSTGDAAASGSGTSSSDYFYAGGFLGYSSSGTISITQCYALGSATTTVSANGYAFAGGFGGYLTNANVSKCYSKGDAQAVAAVSYAGVGGFTGYYYGSGTMTDSFSTGNAAADCSGNERAGGLSGVVQNASVSHCYSAGIPSVDHDASLLKCGGLVGVNNAGSISNSYYDSTVTGKTDTGRGTPKLTSDMKKPNFVTLLANAGADWKLVSNLNGGYPVLNGIGLGADPTTVVTYKDGADTSTVYGTDTVAQSIVFAQPSWVIPEKTGSSLSGWYTDPSCGSSYKWNFATQTVSGATHTLFAGWEALDTTAPTLTVGSVNRLSDTSATVSFTSDEAGTFYYNVVDDGEAEPVIDTTGTGNSCTASETTIGLVLTAGAKDIYIKVKDAAGNVSTALMLDIAAYMIPDTVAPVLTAGAVIRLSDASATVAFTSGEAGTYYYGVMDDEVGEPFIDTDAAGTICGIGENVISITTLTIGAKDIYIKVKDAAGNVSTALKMDIPDAYVPVTGIEAVPASAAAAVDLVLTGTVIPAEATNQAIVWSLINAGTTGAVLNGSTLSTLSEGTVTVKATVEHGTLPTADYTQEFNIPVYIMSHNTLQEHVETTTVIAEGLIADTAQLIVLPIADGDSDRVELENQLTDQSAIAAYEVHMVPAEAFRPPLTLTFQVSEIYNGRTVYILHQLANGTTDVYNPTVTNGQAVITVYELSPFLLAVDPQVTITKQPQTVLALAGQTATFQVEAEGLDPLTYQWQRCTGDGAAWEDISGATGAGYTTAKVNKSHDGYQYRVIVRDVLGNSATSNTAVLTVTVSPATGDDSQPLVFIVMTVLFAAAVILILRKRRMA
jgi:LPXTG-motif cell wall-anchored protein